MTSIQVKKYIEKIIIFAASTIVGIYLYRVGNGISLFENIVCFGNFQNFLFWSAWWSVVIVMLVRPLFTLFPKNKFFRYLLFFRRSLGIFSALLITVHFVGKFIFDPSLIPSYFSTAGRWNNLIALNARTSELTAVILLLTSNTFAQKKLGKWWKRVQYLSYPYFFTGMVAGSMYSTNIIEKSLYYIPFGIWVILWIVAFRKNKSQF